jgi:hypothetical protein
VRSPAAAPGGGSIVGSLRLTLDGPCWRDAATVFGMLAFAMVSARAVGAPGGGGAVLFFVLFFLPPILAIVTVALEERQIPRLAFLRQLPTRADKWLVLVPMCAFAALLSLPTLVLFRSAALSTAAVVGCSWWGIGIGRWMRRGWLFRIVALPAFGLAPVGTLLAARQSGPQAALAVAIGLGLIGLAISPDLLLAENNSASRRSVEVTRARGAVSSPTPAGQPLGWLMTVVRVHGLSSNALWLWGAIYGSVAVVCFYWWEIMPSLVFFMITRARRFTSLSKRTTLSFFRAQPVSRAQLFLASTLPDVLLIVLCTAAPFFSGHWRAAFDFDARPRSHEWALHRRVLGATFLPATWPAGGFPPEVWSHLHALVRLFVAKVGLLLVASLFWFAAAEIQTDRAKSTRRSGAMTAGFVTAVFLFFLMPGTFVADLFLPPLWLAALSAVAAIVTWWRLEPFGRC